jgi:hypothetical protein
MAPAGERFFTVRLAWSGSEAALAYAESTATDAWDVKLQRLSGAGAAEGNPIPLGSSVGMFAPTISIAASISGYVACWDRAGAAGDLACVALPVGGTSATKGLVTPGVSPAVAYGPAGFGLVFGVGSGNELRSQHLDGSGLALGMAHTVAKSSGAELAAPVLASTKDGYAALEVSWAGILWRFDSSFEEEEGNTLLGWVERPTRIAGGEAHVGAVWPAQQGVMFRVVDAANVGTAPVKIDAVGAASVYSHTDVARGKGSFAAVWSAFEGSMGYRAVGLDGAPLGDARDVLSLGWDDNPVTIVGVADGFLVASATGFSYDLIKVAHLGCP